MENTIKKFVFLIKSQWLIQIKHNKTCDFEYFCTHTDFYKSVKQSSNIIYFLMKAFITGGTGFIGSHLTDRLLKNPDNEISCLVRSNEKWLTNKSVKKVKGDLFDYEVIKNALNGVDVVFHLAALVKAPNWQTFEAANVDATETIVRLAQKAGVKKVVILSSLAASGPSNGVPLTEDSPLKPVSMYGKSKKVMEERIQTLLNDSTAITTIIPPAVYGPREENIHSFFKSAAKGICPIIGNGVNPRVSMIHVQDLISGILAATNYDHDGYERFFISSELTYNWKEIMHATSLALQKKLLPIYVKPSIVRQIGAFVESIGSLVGKYPILNREKAVELSLEWTCSTIKAQELLGYRQQISLEEGIADTIKWYKQHHWL